MQVTDELDVMRGRMMLLAALKAPRDMLHVARTYTCMHTAFMCVLCYMLNNLRGGNAQRQ